MKKTISCTNICIFFLNFAGAKTATHIGRINGTLQNEGAGGEILRKVLLYPGKNGSHLKVRTAHLIQLSSTMCSVDHSTCFFSVAAIWFSSLGPSCCLKTETL